MGRAADAIVFLGKVAEGSDNAAPRRCQLGLAGDRGRKPEKLWRQTDKLQHMARIGGQTTLLPQGKALAVQGWDNVVLPSAKR